MNDWCPCGNGDCHEEAIPERCQYRWESSLPATVNDPDQEPTVAQRGKD
jgi:hypothetical protein